MSVPSPFADAKQEWLERYGSYITRAAQWRMFAFICLVITGLSVAGNVMQASQNKIVPYIIEVDKVGKSVGVARADVASAAPQRVIQADVAAAIVNWRTVTADVELQERMVTRLSAFVAGGAKNVLRTWFEENNPYLRAKKSLVSVHVKGLPLPVSKDSWRVEWTETERTHTGIVQQTNSYEATITVAIIPAESEQQIMVNPSGVTITAISFGKLLNQ